MRPLQAFPLSSTNAHAQIIVQYAELTAHLMYQYLVVGPSPPFDFIKCADEIFNPFSHPRTQLNRTPTRRYPSPPPSLCNSHNYYYCVAEITCPDIDSSTSLGAYPRAGSCSTPRDPALPLTLGDVDGRGAVSCHAGHVSLGGGRDLDGDLVCRGTGCDASRSDIRLASSCWTGDRCDAVSLFHECRFGLVGYRRVGGGRPFVLSCFPFDAIVG